MGVKFQSTPLREGRHLIAASRGFGSWFQSTPLREGRPLLCADMLHHFLSFNPRPCARGDVDPWQYAQAGHEFQSTPLREGRPWVFFSFLKRLPVSIHAPARGATSG